MVVSSERLLIAPYAATFVLQAGRDVGDSLSALSDTLSQTLTMEDEDDSKIYKDPTDPTKVCTVIRSI